MGKKCLAVVICAIDQCIVKLFRWKHVPGSDLKFVYFVPHKHKGKPVHLNDGVVIEKGDLVAEIHFDNRFLGKNDTRYANILRWTKKEMRNIKNCLETDIEPYHRIKAIHGNATIHQIMARMGFTIVENRKHFFTWIIAGWENVLRLVLKQTKRKKERFVAPKECWISASQTKELW